MDIDTQVNKSGLAEKTLHDIQTKGFSLIHENVLRAAGITATKLIEEIGDGNVFFSREKFGIYKFYRFTGKEKESSK